MTEMTIGSAGDKHSGTDIRYRAQRLTHFIALADQCLAIKSECRVLDLGGNTRYWRDLAPVWQGRNLTFTLVNKVPETETSATFTSILGDARDLPQFGDSSFDIVHSNSVLEHVGRWADMRAMAREVRRLAPHYFVQTPYYWFPLEPHFRVPFFNWLPEPVRLSLVRWRGCGAFPRAETVDDAVRFIEDSNLLDETRFRALFPDAQIRRERVYGLTKSLMAVR